MVQNKLPVAIILAAGYSSRMGSFKPLLPLGDKTVLERLITTIKEAGIKEIIIVTGYNRDKLSPIISKYGLVEAYNSDYEKGMFSSIQTGIKAAKNVKEGYFLFPVDCPLIDENTIKTLMENMDEELMVPTFRGKKGHPLFVPEKYRQEILEYDGPNGLKAITDKYFEKTKRIAVDKEGILLDMDSPKSYNEVKDFLMKRSPFTSFHEMAKGRRFILIRHGQILQHKGKIFLGQTDVKLSDKGKSEAKKAIECLPKDLKSLKIYTSPLLRAKETAQIIKDKTPMELLLVPEFMEMNLGNWDGKYIEEIKEKEAEEFRFRGENIFVYKKGNKSENFYDLQYRVIKKLSQILEEDQEKDIVIVAHKAVLRAIENNLMAKNIDESWEEIKTGGVKIIEQI